MLARGVAASKHTAPSHMIIKYLFNQKVQVIWLILLFSLTLSQSSYYSRSDYSLFIDEEFLETGDIIFRTGGSVLSHAVLLNDPTSEFSHVGIVYKSNTRSFVIHIAPSEGAAVLTSTSFAQIEPLESFLSLDKASLAAVFRLHSADKNIAKHATDIARSYVDEQRTFDFDLDLATEEQLYCTELVWRAYNEAGIDLVDKQFDNLSILFSEQNKYYILPSRLAKSKHVYQVLMVSSP
ncbi:hypothetical protein EYB53_001990 [Candidatus Chloroploca sp. M-50]|uniref:Permuted papain-like amidase YaeF/Yiix C92 family enzyme n=1 Tax=Candidatus Chloroploca mongolica TaxID=2528176 RepID=A0ABS4D4X2_9CHLR|nr:YiiX/YebB-like N1pC/P60 family cysteine hydrolase [Candidatus Chloroploca mongolica]MBP1464469.1 hypothetical protein [Candidatus Chloroploca mongolica]